MRRHLVLVPVAALGLSLGVAGCSDPPTSGRVISNEYNKAHNEEYMYCAIWQTVNNVLTCTLWLTGENWVKDQWKIRLLSEDGKHKGWLTVSQRVYDLCGIDRFYDECAQEK